jgi:hypothetical protein
MEFQIKKIAFFVAGFRNNRAVNSIQPSTDIVIIIEFLK